MIFDDLAHLALAVRMCQNLDQILSLLRQQIVQAFDVSMKVFWFHVFSPIAIEKLYDTNT